MAEKERVIAGSYTSHRVSEKQQLWLILNDTPLNLTQTLTVFLTQTLMII